MSVACADHERVEAGVLLSPDGQWRWRADGPTLFLQQRHGHFDSRSSVRRQAKCTILVINCFFSVVLCPGTKFNLLQFFNLHKYYGVKGHHCGKVKMSLPATLLCPGAQSRLKTRSHCVRRRTSTQTLQMLNYILFTVVVNGHNRVAVRHRTATDGKATQHAE